tara:strand:+ start:98 stop:274 length:177 start_codon:yes stop_codon:yes gene_type:complete
MKIIRGYAFPENFENSFCPILVSASILRLIKFLLRKSDTVFLLKVFTSSKLQAYHQSV